MQRGNKPEATNSAGQMKIQARCPDVRLCLSDRVGRLPVSTVFLYNLSRALTGYRFFVIVYAADSCIRFPGKGRAGVAAGEKQQSDDMRENKSFERVYLI